ncbi:MAG: hypothetical protein ACLUIQ_01480 [Dialister invisus]
MLGASASLGISDIPWDGPIAGVRVGCVDGKFVINPTQEQLKVSTLNITVAGSETAILMVEGGAQEAPEEDVLTLLCLDMKPLKNWWHSRRRLLKK